MNAADSVNDWSWLPNDETPTQKAVELYAAHGFIPVPDYGIVPDFDGQLICSCRDGAACSKPGKHPRLTRWSHSESGVDAALERFRQVGPCNVALVMRDPYFALDVDVHGVDGMAALLELQQHHGQLPATLRAMTGSGGSHLLYRLPESVAGLINEGKFNHAGPTTKATGLECKYHPNGKITVAPSIQVSGIPYRWVDRRPPAMAPDWLIKLLPRKRDSYRPTAPPKPMAYEVASASKRISSYIEAAIANGCNEVRAAEKGGRNDVLNGAAFQVFQLLIGERLDTESASRAFMHAARDAKLGEAESRQTLKSALEAAYKSPKQVPPPKPRAERPSRPPPDEDEEPRPAASEPPPEEDWTERFRRGGKGGKGVKMPSISNAMLILENDPEWRGTLRFNRLRMMIEHPKGDIEETDVTDFQVYCERRWDVTFGPNVAMAALARAARWKAYHPVYDYLTGLTWDGVPRIGRIAEEVWRLKEPSRLIQRMVECWFISAAARGIKPGENVQHALVLLSKRQGLFKSTFFRTLAGEFFGDQSVDVTDKDGLMVLHWSWIHELPEIDTMTGRKDQNRIRAAIPIIFDRFRAPYDRTVGDHKRGFVLVGSTNNDELLTDPTGSRRYHVVEVYERLNIELLAEWRDQLWAEAVHRYRAGEPWHLSVEEDAEREEYARSFQERDIWSDAIEDWLKGHPQEYYTADQILTACLGIDRNKLDNSQRWRINRVMSLHGYVHKPVRINGNMRKALVKDELFKRPERQSKT